MFIFIELFLALSKLCALILVTLSLCLYYLACYLLENFDSFAAPKILQNNIH